MFIVDIDLMHPACQKFSLARAHITGIGVYNSQYLFLSPTLCSDCYIVTISSDLVYHTAFLLLSDTFYDFHDSFFLRKKITVEIL